MARLYLAILYLCWHHGEVIGLSDLADLLGMSWPLIYRRLAVIERMDPRLAVERAGRGRRIRISYRFEDQPKVIRIVLRGRRRDRSVISFPEELRYRV